MSKLRTANLLGALASEVAGRLDRSAKAHPNQTLSASAALNLIGFYEGCSNTELSRALQLSHTATVRLVDKLEETGLVESRQGKEDRRSVALHLTKAGRARARQILQERCVVLEEIVDALAPAQQGQLEGLLEILLRALTPHSAEAGNHICRLCDETACPADKCPVHLTSHALYEAS